MRFDHLTCCAPSSRASYSVACWLVATGQFYAECKPLYSSTSTYPFVESDVYWRSVTNIRPPVTGVRPTTYSTPEHASYCKTVSVRYGVFFFASKIAVLHDAVIVGASLVTTARAGFFINSWNRYWYCSLDSVCCKLSTLYLPFSNLHAAHYAPIEPRTDIKPILLCPQIERCRLG